MAQRGTHPVTTPRQDVQWLFATLTGGGAATAAALSTQEAANGDIVSAAHAGSDGAYTIVFRHSYPVLKASPSFRFVGDTIGFNGRCSAIDVVAKTATFVFAVSTTPTDLPTTTTVYIDWVVRNTSRNP
jgi:hypothetical protein